MDWFNIIPKITTPFALIAFLATIFFLFHKSKWRSKEKIIDGIQEDHKLDAINAVLRDFTNIDTSGLNKKQKYELTQQLITQKIQRFKILTFVSIFIALLLASVIIMINEKSQNQKASNDKGLNLEPSMVANFQAEDFGSAERVADQILQIDPNNKRALTVKGAIAYMNEDFQTTISYYTRAFKSDSTNSVIIGNLSWVYTDTESFELALRLLNKIQDGKPDWFERVARVHLYSYNFTEAKNYLRSIPNNYHHGIARIQEAVCLIGISNNLKDRNLRLKTLKQAKEKLLEGVSQEKTYWDPILTEKTRDARWPVKVEIKLLKPILASID